MILDIRTLYFLNFLVNLISTAMLTTIWLQYRKRYHGLWYWALATGFLAVAFGFFLLRDTIPDLFSIMLGNFFILAGSFSLLLGFERFFGIQSGHRHNYLILSSFLLIQFYFFAIQPTIRAREIVISVFIILFSFQSCWLLFRRVSSNFRKISTFTGLILSGFVFFSLLRIYLLIFSTEQGNNIFAYTPANSLTLTFYFLLFILLVISLVLIVNTRLLQEVHKQEEKFYKAFHSASSAIILSKADTGEIVEVNGSFEQMSGYRSSEVLGKTTMELKLWDQEDDRSMLFALIEQGKAQSIEIKVRNRAGKLLTGLFSADILEVNGEAMIISSFSDITEISEIKRQLHDLATHDPLTKLPNRSLFYDRFEVALATSKRNQRGFAIMSLDLDNLKTINDQYGHLTGDRALIETGYLLTASLRKSDTVARFGGDEFLILVNDIQSPEDARKVAQKITDNFKKPFLIQDEEILVTASLGVALYPNDGNDLQTLMKKSDQALYHVKENGRDGFHLGQSQFQNLLSS